MTISGRSNNGGAGVEDIPPASTKMVANLKEIVNCSELEIYATLKDCGMDPNEAVNRLLSQDPFHQVKSKRDKKKECKDYPETKFHVGSSTSHRSFRSDRVRGNSVQYSSKDSRKKENGKNFYTTSLSAQVAPENPNWGSSAFSNCVTMENEMLKRSVVEKKSASQTNSGHHSERVVVPGQKAVTEIAKTGRPQNSAANKLQEFSSSESQVLKFTEQYEKPGAVSDKRPLFEPPESTDLSLVMDSSIESQLHPVRSDLPYKSTQQMQSWNVESKEQEEESLKNCNDYHVGHAAISDKTLRIRSGNATLHGKGMHTKSGPYQSNYACQNEEVKDGVATSLLSGTANFQQLSIQEEERKPSCEEGGPSVVIPDHLQVQSSDCSHLSFGSFRSGLATGFYGSRSLRNNMEETPIAGDASVIRKADNREVEYNGEEAFSTAGTLDSASASASDFIKQEYPELEAHGSQYNIATNSSNYSFQNAHQQNLAFGYAQTSSWMQDLAPFSNAMVYTDSSSSTLLAANIPVVDSEIAYAPFPAAQSMAKYGNTAYSMNGSSISVEEALKTGLQSLHPTQQHLSGKRVASEQSDYQHLAAHQNSQPTHPLGPFANMDDYTYLPRSERYMPSAFQQAFAGNGVYQAFSGSGPYHQSLDAVLPQYKNSAPVSSLPQSATVPCGYGNFGYSTASPGNYVMNPSVVPAGSTIGYDDLLSTCYVDNTYSIPFQQNENSATWLNGHGSGTSAVPASTYYSLQGQNQHPDGFGQGQQSSANDGYANFYNHQTGMPLDQKRKSSNGSLGGSYAQSKQPQQIWQNSY